MKKNTINTAFFLIASFFLFFLYSCSKKPEERVIARIKGNPVYMKELEYFGKITVPKAGLEFNTEEGQKQFKEIAPNLYNSIIDIYVMKYAAEGMDIQPTEEELETKFQQYKQGLIDKGYYKQFTESLGLDEEKFRESMKDHLSVQLLQKKIMSDVDYEPTEKEMKDYYNKNLEQFLYPARIRLSSIYIKAPVSEGKEARRLAKEKALEIRKKIGERPEETFSNLARKYSDDPYSVTRGGDFGYIKRHDPKIDEEFLKEAFSLKEGDVSDVVETDIGYHIIWVTAHEQLFENAKEEIKHTLINQKKSDYFHQWMDQKREEMNVERLFDPKSFTFIEEEKEA